jgi:hypothetical protein
MSKGGILGEKEMRSKKPDGKPAPAFFSSPPGVQRRAGRGAPDER